MPITMNFSTLTSRQDHTLTTSLTSPVDAVTVVLTALAGMEPSATFVSMEHQDLAEATVTLPLTLRTATVSCGTDRKVTVALTEPSGVRQDVRYPLNALTSTGSLTRIAVRIACFLHSGKIIPTTTTRKDPS